MSAYRELLEGARVDSDGSAQSVIFLNQGFAAIYHVRQAKARADGCYKGRSEDAETVEMIGDALWTLLEITGF